jgi:hypothetical protein
MGKPKITSAAATTTASRIVSQNACQSICRQPIEKYYGQYSQSEGGEVPMWADASRNVH